MAESPGPFFYSQIKCPVCESVNSYTNVRTLAFRVSGKDTDYCPSGVIWADPAYQRIDPLLFFMATCLKCFYTREYNAEFKSWSKDAGFAYRLPKIKAKHLTALADKNGLIQFLAPHFDPEKYPIESAVIKFILGIADERITTSPSPLNLGRYFLRIAWLFRGRAKSGVASAEGFFTFGDFEQFLIKARELLSDIPTTEQEALVKAAEHYRKAYETGSDVEQGLAQVQAAYLIAELSRRAGDFKIAEQYFNATIKMGRELVQSGEVDVATVNQTNRLLATAVEQAHLNRDDQAAAAK